MGYSESERRRAAQDALQFGEAGVQPVGPDTAGDAYASEDARPCYTGDETAFPSGGAGTTTLLDDRAPYNAYGTYAPQAAWTAQPAQPPQAAWTAQPQSAAPHGSRIQGNAVLSNAPAAPVADTRTDRRAGDDRTSRLLRRAALWLVIAAVVIVGGAIALDFGKTFLQELGNKVDQAASSLADSAANAVTDAVKQAADTAIDGVTNAAGDLVNSALSSLG